MDKRLSQKKIMLGTDKLDTATFSNKEYIWRNIFKIEALKKEDALRKSQVLCKNLQIKL